MRRYSLLFKLLAFILASLCLLTALFCGYGTISLFSANLYQEYPDSLAESLCYEDGRQLALNAAREYAATTIGNCPKELVEHLYGLHYYGGSLVSISEEGEEVYSRGDSVKDGITIHYSLRFDCPTIVEKDTQKEEPGNIAGGSDNTDTDDTQDQTTTTPSAPDTTQRPIYTYEVLVSGKRIVYEVRYTEITLDATVTLDQSKLNNTNYQMLSTFFPYRYLFIWGFAITLLSGIALVVYLLWVAGRGKGGVVELVGLSKLPLDVYALFVCLLFLGLHALFYALFDTIYTFHILVFNLIGIALTVPMLLGFFYIFAAQSKCKGGYWWHHSLIGRFCRFCFKGIGALLNMLPAIWQWLIIGFVMFSAIMLSFILGFLGDEPFFRLIFLLSSVISLAVICYGGYCFGLILIGSKKMAQGQLDHQIPEKHLFGAFRDCARQLNSLSGAANTAVQSQLRSERMKTELITNVSHDIKTPLTSIINFVDLLEKPHTEEDAEQYLEVLSRQSLRLKKLIEDLMELSKANSGNIAVNLITLDAVEAANQALGEFADKMENAQLTPIFRAPENPLPILADGRLLWRVLSNLLSNTVKYAAPNTRVYVDLASTGDQVQLSIRNISKTELTVTAEELLERFVRGDVSRNTEGSGLGLNIAKSLMEVQHGTLELILDGDLFKVTLTFPSA